MESSQMDIPWYQKMLLPGHPHEQHEHQIEGVIIAGDRNSVGRAIPVTGREGP
jgi:hypothetical protein